MKTRTIIAVVFSLLVLLNILIGAVTNLYDMSTCMLVSGGIILTGIAFMFLFSGLIADGFKIGMSWVFITTGILRTVAMAFIGQSSVNSIALLAFAIILVIEIILLLLLTYLSKK